MFNSQHKMYLFRILFHTFEILTLLELTHMFVVLPFDNYQNKFSFETILITLLCNFHIVTTTLSLYNCYKTQSYYFAYMTENRKKKHLQIRKYLPKNVYDRSKLTFDKCITLKQSFIWFMSGISILSSSGRNKCK